MKVKVLRDKIALLTKQLTYLKQNYKPCDSQRVVTLPVFITNDAEVQALHSQLAKKDQVIQGKDETISQKDKQIGILDKWKWRFFILAGSISLGLIFRIFIYKKPI
jgi:hypothetical protein